MIDNTELLREFLTNKRIRLCDSDLLWKTPANLPSNFNFTKVEGMLLGVAIGDALGAPSEGMLPSERQQRYGEVRDYVPSPGPDYQAVGVPTDDTQLTFWTLQQLLVDGGFIPDNVARRFCRHHIRGIGLTTQAFVRNYKDRHIPWHSCGLDSLGNGALMRISPIVIPYLRRPHPSMYADAALDAMMTHNAFANTATCVAFVSILWSLLTMKSAPEPKWWVYEYCSLVEKLEGNTKYVRRGRNGSYTGPLWQFTERVISDALRKGLSVREACDAWGSGANLFETVPSVLYILARHAENAEEAIIRAANDTRDNDTVGAIVGAAVGALHGAKCFPDRWIRKLTGGTRSEDDGEVFRLIIMARRTFWS